MASFGTALLLAAALCWGAWWAMGAPVSVPDAPPGKVRCVSYTPFRGSESPFDPTYVADPARMEEDLRLLSGVSDCIRLYAPDQGLSMAVPIAAAHGMRVLLGIWIGADDAANESQIRLGLTLAEAFRPHIKALVVGNEVLLRGEQTAHAMAAFVRRVKRLSGGLPVTYADVTDFWLTAPDELADAVDFITIHILPYWEDEPASAAHAVQSVESAVARVHTRFPEKPIVIGEIGFPSQGRERETAVPSLVSQARFLRSFVAYAHDSNLDYNLIEAFDQPWKRLLEGTVGGSWGLFDEARQPKFPWRGPVSNHPQWMREAGASAASAFVLLLGWFMAGRLSSVRRAGLLGNCAGAAGILLVLQAEHSWAAWRSGVELAVEGLVFVASLAAAFFLPPEMAKGRGAVAPASVALTLQFLRAPRRMAFDRTIGLGGLRLAAAISALVVSLCLAFDPRYRDFPIAAFTAPAVGFAWISLARKDAWRAVTGRYEEAVLAVLFAATAAIILVNETPRNLEADLWCAIALLMALPWVGAVRGAELGRWGG
ncbi:MAG: glycoside hydrolase family 17 [Alphaproteobacteria bacterium]